MVQVVKNPPANAKKKEMLVQPLGREDPLQQEMATAPVFLPAKSQGQRRLMGYSPWGHRESDVIEWLRTACLEEGKDLISAPSSYVVTSKLGTLRRTADVRRDTSSPKGWGGIRISSAIIKVLPVKGFSGGSDGTESSYNAGDPGSISGLSRSPGKENGHPL